MTKYLHREKHYFTFFLFVPIFLIILLTFIFFLYNNALITKKTKAANDSNFSTQVVLSQAEVKKDEDVTVSIKVKSVEGARIIGYVGDVSFDKTKLALKDLQYKMGVVSKDLGQDIASKSAINTTGVIHIQGEVQTSMGYILGPNELTEVISLVFTVLEQGKPTISFLNSKWYKINTDNTLTEVLSPDTIGTGTSSTSVSLSVQVRFQGVTTIPAGTSIPVKVKLSGGELTQPTQYQTFTMVASGSGIFGGEVSFPVKPGKGYAVFMKGPKHVQRKICDTSASDSEQKLYVCSQPGLDFSQQNTALSFPNVYLFAGDLPLANGQKGVVSAAVDAGTIRTIILEGKGRLPDSVAKADVNYDGVVDSQDYSLVIKTLEKGMIKDEE